MSDSLQQQLINAGLVSAERAEELARKPTLPGGKRGPKAGGKSGGNKPGGDGKRRRGKGAKSGPRPDKANADAKAARRPGQRRGGAAGKGPIDESKLDPAAQAELARKRALKAEIKALIEANSVADWKGEMTFNYVVGERIRQVFVNADAHCRITAGELAITRLNRHTHLVAPEIAAQLTALNPDWLVVINDPAADTATVSGKDEEDPYADYQVPDDLHW